MSADLARTTVSRKYLTSILDNMLDAVFVRVPNERNPGFLAVVVFFCRQFVFSGLAMIALVLGYLAFANPHLTEDPNFLVFGMILASGPLVFFEELGRYAFVRRAERPLRALAIYTAATAAVCALFFRNDLLVVAWTTGATVLIP